MSWYEQCLFETLIYISFTFKVSVSSLCECLTISTGHLWFCCFQNLTMTAELKPGHMQPMYHLCPTDECCVQTVDSLFKFVLV